MKMKDWTFFFDELVDDGRDVVIVCDTHKEAVDFRSKFYRVREHYLAAPALEQIYGAMLRSKKVSLNALSVTFGTKKNADICEVLKRRTRSGT